MKATDQIMEREMSINFSSKKLTKENINKTLISNPDMKFLVLPFFVWKGLAFLCAVD
jgi:hypothetical protein